MLKVFGVQVYDLERSVIAARNPMRTEPFIPKCEEDIYNEFVKSLPRAVKLCQQSSKDEKVKCHDNFLTGIRVSFDIIYPQYITPELQRYHWIDIVSSSSKMHKLLFRPADEACNKYVSQVSVDELQKSIDKYNEILNKEEYVPVSFCLRSGEIITPEDKNDALYIARIIAMSNCPMGYELFMRVSTNYKQLQTIYWQRKDHRLKEDWGAFCKFVEELPYAKEFILGQ